MTRAELPILQLQVAVQVEEVVLNLLAVFIPADFMILLVAIKVGVLRFLMTGWRLGVALGSLPVTMTLDEWVMKPSLPSPIRATFHHYSGVG